MCLLWFFLLVWELFEEQLGLQQHLHLLGHMQKEHTGARSGPCGRGKGCLLVAGLQVLSNPPILAPRLVPLALTPCSRHCTAGNNPLMAEQERERDGSAWWQLGLLEGGQYLTPWCFPSSHCWDRARVSPGLRRCK